MARSYFPEAAPDRKLDAIEDRVDEVGEAPGYGAAVVLPAEHRFADRRAANVTEQGQR
jgi:hypothetical protein